MEATSEGRAIAWSLLVAPGVVNAAGYPPDLYARLWWFDRIRHACTIFAVTFWLALFVRRRVFRSGPCRDALLLAMVIASVGPAVGAPWEVAEWGFDRVASGDVIKGKHDTIVDAVMDTLGAVGAGFVGLAFLRPAAASSAAPETP